MNFFFFFLRNRISVQFIYFICFLRMFSARNVQNVVRAATETVRRVRLPSVELLLLHAHWKRIFMYLHYRTRSNMPWNDLIPAVDNNIGNTYTPFTETYNFYNIYFDTWHLSTVHYFYDLCAVCVCTCCVLFSNVKDNDLKTIKTKCIRFQSLFYDSGVTGDCPI